MQTRLLALLLLLAATAVGFFRIGSYRFAQSVSTEHLQQTRQGPAVIVAIFQPGDCPGMRESLGRLNELNSDVTTVRGILVGASLLSAADVEAVLAAADIAFPVTLDGTRAWNHLLEAAGYRRTPVFFVYRDGRLTRASNTLESILE